MENITYEIDISKLTRVINRSFDYDSQKHLGKPRECYDTRDKFLQEGEDNG